jgi:hypothetical protein
MVGIVDGARIICSRVPSARFVMPQIPVEQVSPFEFSSKQAKRINRKARGRTVKTAPPSTGPPLAETPISGGATPNSEEAWLQGLRDYLRTPTPMCTIILLTPRETAKHLRTTERTLERRRLTGDGPPFVKIGALIRYPLDELEEWLAARLQWSTSETAAPTHPRLRQRA